MEQMEYPVLSPVARKRRWCWPTYAFGSYQESPQQAFRNAARLMAAGAHMVKIEGGCHHGSRPRDSWSIRGIPVCAHIGLTP